MSAVELVRYDAMCLAIAEAHRVDEAKDIRDKALALEAYHRQARNVEAERKAAEIRIRAERRCGELLKDMQRAGERETRGGDRRSKSDRSTLKKSLKDLRISKDQASRFQQLADIPKDEFEATVATRDIPSAYALIRRRRNSGGKPGHDRSADPDERWHKVVEALESLLEFQQKYTPDQLAPYVSYVERTGGWSQEELEQMRTLPNYVAELQVELQRLCRQRSAEIETRLDKIGKGTKERKIAA